MKPNLFDYATSELSQDAFLLWLLEWGNPCYLEQDKNLNAISQTFIRKILGEKDDFEITEVKVFKQQQHIDVLAIINNSDAIIIEDKTNTSEHSRQISTYTDVIKKKYPDLSLTCVYYKSGNESKQSIRNMNTKYKKLHPDAPDIFVLTRKEMIGILTSEECNNEILVGYLSYLQEIEHATNSYMTKPVKEWDWRAWQGFYMLLEDTFGFDKDLGWGSVPQKNGGFQGCWFCYRPIPYSDGALIYIQIEGFPYNLKDTKLCFKICHIPNQPIAACREWSKKIMDFAHEEWNGHHVEIKKLSRFRRGDYMTVAGVSGKDVFGEGIINVDAIIKLLWEYRGIVERVAMKKYEIYEKPFTVKSIHREAVRSFMLTYFRKSSPFFPVSCLDSSANIRQDDNGYWIGEDKNVWDTDRQDRKNDWEEVVREMWSINDNGEQVELIYKCFD